MSGTAAQILASRNQTTLLAYRTKGQVGLHSGGEGSSEGDAEAEVFTAPFTVRPEIVKTSTIKKLRIFLSPLGGVLVAYNRRIFGQGNEAYRDAEEMPNPEHWANLRPEIADKNE